MRAAPRQWYRPGSDALEEAEQHLDADFETVSSANESLAGLACCRRMGWQDAFWQLGRRNDVAAPSAVSGLARAVAAEERLRSGHA